MAETTEANTATTVTYDITEAFGKFLFYVSTKVANKLDAESGKIAQRMVKKVCSKLPPKIIKEFLRITFEKVNEVPLTEGTLERLGCCATHLTTAQISITSAATWVSSIPNLGSCCWSKEAAESIIQKSELSFSAISADSLSAMCGLVKGLTLSNLNAIPKEVFDASWPYLKSCKFDSGLARKLLELTTAVSGSRKRRSVTVDLSAKTGTELIDMGSALFGATPAEIRNIDPTAFSEAVQDLGLIANCSVEQYQAFIHVAKQAWGAINTFDHLKLASLGKFIYGMTADELKMTNMSNIDTISALSTKEEYTTAQKTAGWDRVVALHGSMSAMTGDLVAALNHFALAAPASELETMTNGAFETATSPLGALTAWSAEQLQKLSRKAIAVYGAPATWDTGVVRQLGSIVGGLTAAEIGTLDATTISFITPDAIASIPAETFAGLSADQVGSLGEDQAQYLTTDQISSLPEDQQNLIKNLGGISGDGSGWGTGGNSAATGLIVGGSHLALQIVSVISSIVLLRTLA